MNVSEIMTPHVTCISPDDNLLNAARWMKDADTGALPVTSPDGEVLGMLTDRDIVVRVLAEGADLQSLHVGEVMTQNPITCRPDCPVDDAASTMRQRQIRRLIITEGHNRHVLGMLSLGDIAARAHERELVGQAEEGICRH